MAFSGQALDNPISGERFVFHTTADDSAGALLAFDLVLDPDGHVPGGHVHPVQQESFQVLRGTMKFRKRCGPRSHPAWSARSSRRSSGWQRAAVWTSATADCRTLRPGGRRPPTRALAGSPALVLAPRARLPLDLDARPRPAVSAWLARGAEAAAFRSDLRRR